jgi:aspartyl/asparaginyl-tRNA synthetase
MVEDVGAYAKKYLLSDDEEAGELCEAFDPELVAKLKASCEQMEYQEAEDILRELKKKSYPEELSKTLEEMLASCESFDYEHLETLLEEL